MKILIMAAALMFSLFATADHHGGMKHSTAKSNDIVDVAIANGSFTTLVTAVKAAGLVDMINSLSQLCSFLKVSVLY